MLTDAQEQRRENLQKQARKDELQVQFGNFVVVDVFTTCRFSLIRRCDHAISYPGESLLPW